MTTNNDDKCLEYSRIERYNDKSLRELINKEYDVDNLYSASVEEKQAMIRDIYYYTNTSIRQLGRVMGIGKSVIEKAIKQDK